MRLIADVNVVKVKYRRDEIWGAAEQISQPYSRYTSFNGLAFSLSLSLSLSHTHKRGTKQKKKT